MNLLRIRPWRLSMLVVLTVLFAVQLVPYGHARTNPPVVREPSWDSPGTRALARAGREVPDAWSRSARSSGGKSRSHR